MQANLSNSLSHPFVSVSFSIISLASGKRKYYNKYIY